MTRLKLTSAICGGIISLAGTSLLAQQSSLDQTQSGANPSSNRTGQDSSRISDTSRDHQGSSSVTDTSSRWHHGKQNVRLSEIMRAPVQGSNGQNLGQIQDLTFDPRSGHVQFAILSLANSSGASSLNSGTASSSVANNSSASPSKGASAGSTSSSSNREVTPSSRSSLNGSQNDANYSGSASAKLIPVPWQLFSQSWNRDTAGSTSGTTATGAMTGHALVLNLDEAKLQGAPSFNNDKWSDFHQGTFDQRVYSYYGVSPMTGVGQPGSSVSGQGTGDYGPQNGSAKGGGIDLQK